MRLLNSYIRNVVLKVTGIVIMILFGVEFFMEFIGQLSQVETAHFDFIKACLFVLTRLPSDLYQLFPIAAFLGCLIGLGRLASSSELIVMRAAGISIGGIAYCVVKAVVLMIFLMTVVGEVIAPSLVVSGEKMKSIALLEPIGYRSLAPLWLRDAESFIFIGSITSNQEISNISRFVMNEKQELLWIDYAPKGRRIQGQWVLEEVIRSQFGVNKLRKVYLKKLPLSLIFDPEQTAKERTMLEQRALLQQQSLKELYNTIRYRNKAGLQTDQYLFIFWKRLFQPLSTVVMVCLGVPFIFGSLRQVSMGIRILTGLIVGFVFYILNQLLGPFAMLYQIPPIYAASIPTVLFAISSVFLLRYSRR